MNVIDLKRSSAVCIGHTLGFGAIHVTVRGPARGEIVRRLLKDLSSLSNDIGLSVKVDAYVPREMYWGDSVDLLPDIIISVNN